MTNVRNALRIRDPRLTPAIVAILVILAIDFFGRVALFSPSSSGPDIEELVILSDAIPQIGQSQVDSYLSKIDSMRARPAQSEAPPLSRDLAAQQQIRNEASDGYWRAGELSYKLVALVESTERFAVLYSLDFESGAKELIELRPGDSIAEYSVSEVLAKELRLTSDNGDQITLALFEAEQLKD